MLNETEIKIEEDNFYNSENQNPFEDVEVKIEEEEKDCSENLHQFSYTLDLSYCNAPKENLSPNSLPTSASNSTLKYVKLNADNIIETNSDTPWTLAKKLFPRSLERILRTSGFEVRKKCKTGSSSLSKGSKTPLPPHRKLRNDRISLWDKSYVDFKSHNDVFNSTVNSKKHKLREPDIKKRCEKLFHTNHPSLMNLPNSEKLYKKHNNTEEIIRKKKIKGKLHQEEGEEHIKELMKYATYNKEINLHFDELHNISKFKTKRKKREQNILIEEQMEEDNIQSRIAEYCNSVGKEKEEQNQLLMDLLNQALKSFKKTKERDKSERNEHYNILENRCMPIDKISVYDTENFHIRRFIEKCENNLTNLDTKKKKIYKKNEVVNANNTDVNKTDIETRKDKIHEVNPFLLDANEKEGNLYDKNIQIPRPKKKIKHKKNEDTDYSFLDDPIEKVNENEEISTNIDIYEKKGTKPKKKKKHKKNEVPGSSDNSIEKVGENEEEDLNKKNIEIEENVSKSKKKMKHINETTGNFSDLIENVNKEESLYDKDVHEVNVVKRKKKKKVIIYSSEDLIEKVNKNGEQDLNEKDNEIHDENLTKKKKKKHKKNDAMSYSFDLIEKVDENIENLNGKDIYHGNLNKPRKKKERKKKEGTNYSSKDLIEQLNMNEEEDLDGKYKIHEEKLIEHKEPKKHDDKNYDKTYSSDSIENAKENEEESCIVNEDKQEENVTKLTKKMKHRRNKEDAEKICDNEEEDLNAKCIAVYEESITKPKKKKKHRRNEEDVEKICCNEKEDLNAKCIAVYEDTITRAKKKKKHRRNEDDVEKVCDNEEKDLNAKCIAVCEESITKQKRKKRHKNNEQMDSQFEDPLNKFVNNESICLKTENDSEKNYICEDKLTGENCLLLTKVNLEYDDFNGNNGSRKNYNKNCYITEVLGTEDEGWKVKSKKKKNGNDVRNEEKAKFQLKEKSNNQNLKKVNYDTSLTENQDDLRTKGNPKHRRKTDLIIDTKHMETITTNKDENKGSGVSIIGFENKTLQKRKKTKKILNFEDDKQIQMTTKIKSSDLDKLISDILSTKIEALFETSLLDQGSNELKNPNKKSTPEIKILNSTVNMISDKKNNKIESNTKQHENNYYKLIENHTTGIYASEYLDVTSDSCSKNVLDKIKKKRKKKQPVVDVEDSISDENLYETGLPEEKDIEDITDLTNMVNNEKQKKCSEKNIENSESASTSESEGSIINTKNNLIDSNLAIVDESCGEEKKLKKKNTSIDDMQDESILEILEFHNERNLSKKSKESAVDVTTPSFSVSNIEQKSGICEITTTKKTLNTERNCSNNSFSLRLEDYDESNKNCNIKKQSNSGKASTSNKRSNTEIFIPTNFCSINEIDLNNSDKDSDLEENEKIHNFKQNFPHYPSVVEITSQESLGQRIEKVDIANDDTQLKEIETDIVKLNAEDNFGNETPEEYSQWEKLDKPILTSFKRTKRKKHDILEQSRKRIKKNTIPNDENRNKKNKIPNDENINNVMKGSDNIEREFIKIESSSSSNSCNRYSVNTEKKNLSLDNDNVREANQDIFTNIFTKTESDNKIYLDENSIDLMEEFLKVENSSSENNKHEDQLYDLPKKESSNLQSTSEILKNDTFSFGDIISESHSNRLMQTFNEIISKSAPKNNTTDNNQDENLKSGPNNQLKPDAEGVKGQRRKPKDKDSKKRQCKQPTLDDFVEGNESLEKTKQKQKVIELLKESRTIHEIEEELDIPLPDKNEVQGLDIVTPWSIPLIHRIAFYVTNRPSAKHRRELKAAGIEPKSGKFTKEEDEKIRQNWKRFCTDHEWDENNYDPFLKGCNRSKRGVLHKYQLHKFVQYISNGFNDRLMYSVYSRFQRLFLHNKWENGRFTAEDDRIIEEYVLSGKSDAPYADLEAILKRSRTAILKRHQLLQSNKRHKTDMVFWNKGLAEELLACIIEATRSVNLSELKDRQITSQEWRKVAKKMNIPTEKLKRAWVFSFYPRFFAPNYIKDIAEVKKKLVDLISARYTDWREINWHDLTEEFDNSFSNAKLCKLLKDMVKTAVPPKKRNNLLEVLKYLKNQETMSKSRDRLNFVKDILKETKNGTVIPKIVKSNRGNEQESDTETTEDSSS